MKARYFLLIWVICIICFGTINISITKNNDKTDIEYKPSTGVTVTKSKTAEDDNCTYTMCSSLGGGVSGDTLAISTMFGE